MNVNTTHPLPPSLSHLHSQVKRADLVQLPVAIAAVWRHFPPDGSDYNQQHKNNDQLLLLFVFVAVRQNTGFKSRGRRHHGNDTRRHLHFHARSFIDDFVHVFGGIFTAGNTILFSGGTSLVSFFLIMSESYIISACLSIVRQQVGRLLVLTLTPEIHSRLLLFTTM